MTTTAYYLNNGTETLGPYTRERLVIMWNNREIPTGWLVAKEGDPKYVDFSAFLQSTPEPAPVFVRWVSIAATLLLLPFTVTLCAGFITNERWFTVTAWLLLFSILLFILDRLDQILSTLRK